MAIGDIDEIQLKSAAEDLGVEVRLNAVVDRADETGVWSKGEFVPAATRGGHRNLFTPGAIPTLPAPWSAFAPKLVELPDGTVRVPAVLRPYLGGLEVMKPVG